MFARPTNIYHETYLQFDIIDTRSFPPSLHMNDNMGSIVPSASPYRLDGKVALVTGAGRGIGAETALQLARCGAKVVVNYVRSAQSADRIVQEIKSLGSDAIAIQANVSKVPETARLFDEAVKHFGKLDIVCSNSGVVSFGHLEDVTEVSSVHIAL